jgi:hypothetical protein
MRTQTLDRSMLAEVLRAALRVLEPAVETATPQGNPSAASEPRRGRGRLRAVDRLPRVEPARPGPVLHTFRSLRDTYQIPRATAYTLIAQGKLERVKIGRRALITDESARALLNLGA